MEPQWESSWQQLSIKLSCIPSLKAMREVSAFKVLKSGPHRCSGIKDSSQSNISDKCSFYCPLVDFSLTSHSCCARALFTTFFWNFFVALFSTGVFSLNETNGEIFTAKPLDYETNSTYVLKVEADSMRVVTSNLRAPSKCKWNCFFKYCIFFFFVPSAAHFLLLLNTLGQSVSFMYIHYSFFFKC